MLKAKEERDDFQEMFMDDKDSMHGSDTKEKHGTEKTLRLRL